MQSSDVSGCIRSCENPAGTAASERSLEEIEGEITELAALLDAAGYRLLEAIREFDRRGGWEGGGCLSCAHWLSWKVGWDLITARERVRVAHALEGLPRTSEALREGRVSYSKVRAMVRVATRENEEYLLGVALDGTASHVEKLVRAYRRVGGRSEELEEAVRQQEERYLHVYTDEDGMVVIRGRLPPEEGACVLKALEAAMESLRESQRAEALEGQNGDGAVQGDDSAESGQKAGWGLPYDSAESYRPAGSDFQDDRGESTEATASAALQDDSAESSTAEPTAEQLRADALALLAELALSSNLNRAERADVFQVVIHVDGQALADPFRDGVSEIESGQRIAADACRRIACEAPTVAVLHGLEGEVLHVGRRTRKVNLPLWRALHSRDRGCQFPGCSRTRHLAVHHIRHWANGGETSPENLVLLCRAHHWAVHEGGFCVQGMAPRRLVFLRPDGTVLPRSPEQPGPIEHPIAALQSRNRRLGLRVPAGTDARCWDGLPMDYDLAVMGLQDLDSQASLESSALA